MTEEKDKNKDPDSHLEASLPSESQDERLFSDDVFKDDLEFEDDIDKLPL